MAVTSEGSSSAKEVEENVKAYLEKEDSSILKKYDGIGLGFVDGDLIIVYRK